MRIVYFGTPDFAVESLDAIMQSRHEVVAVVTVPDRQAGRGQKVVFSPVKQYALDHDLPLMQPEKLRDLQFLEALKGFGADMFVVVAFRMLPEVVWNMPVHGTFNLHASLLPRYRGAAPINWAIINGEHESGVSTFLLNHHIDEGNLLLQRTTPLEPDDNAGTLHDRLAIMGRQAVVDTLDGIEDGTLVPRPQEGEPCPAPKIFAEDCFIDWSRPVEEIERFVRGLAPYPGARFSMTDPQGQTHLFKLFETQAISNPNSVIGHIECDQKSVLKIGASGGFLNIISLQMSGKRQNSIEDFLRGNKLIDWELDV